MSGSSTVPSSRVDKKYVQGQLSAGHIYLRLVLLDAQARWPSGSKEQLSPEAVPLVEQIRQMQVINNTMHSKICGPDNDMQTDVIACLCPFVDNHTLSTRMGKYLLTDLASRPRYAHNRSCAESLSFRGYSDLWRIYH